MRVPIITLYTASFIDGPLHQLQLLIEKCQQMFECIEVLGQIEVIYQYESIPHSSVMRPITFPAIAFMNK